MLKLIAGSCVIESEDLCMEIAGHMKELSQHLNIDYYFKASFAKANRTSGASYRGMGIHDGVDILRKVKEKHGVRIVTDIHEAWQAKEVAGVVDVIQIPAMLSRQTDLIEAAAKTGRIVNIKKSQGADPYSMFHASAKASNAEEIWLTERGTTFGYNNLVVDMRSLEIMKKLGCKVIFDATHSVQLPSGAGDKSTGQREFIAPLARAAVAVGIDGLFMETHPDPDNALSDGPNSIPLHEMKDLLIQLMRIHND